MRYNPYLKHFKCNENLWLEYNGPKPKTAKEAFLISLAKWEFISKHPTPAQLDDGADATCGLCMYFVDCDECPIGKKSKERCLCTPYEEYAESFENDVARKYAKQEYDFIERLYKKHLMKEAKRR